MIETNKETVMLSIPIIIAMIGYIISIIAFYPTNMFVFIGMTLVYVNFILIYTYSISNIYGTIKIGDKK